MHDSEEEWKPVVGYEGIYEVSNQGRVKRVRAGRSTFIGKILRQFVSKRGYYCVNVHRDYQREKLPVHRLVAKAFLEEKAGDECVNHMDGNKLNNKASNLEFTTIGENLQHSARLGLIKKVKTYSEEEKIAMLAACGHRSEMSVAQEYEVNVKTLRRWRGKSY